MCNLEVVDGVVGVVEGVAVVRDERMGWMRKRMEARYGHHTVISTNGTHCTA